MITVQGPLKDHAQAGMTAPPESANVVSFIIELENSTLIQAVISCKQDFMRRDSLVAMLRKGTKVKVTAGGIRPVTDHGFLRCNLLHVTALEIEDQQEIK